MYACARHYMLLYNCCSISIRLRLNVPFEMHTYTVSSTPPSRHDSIADTVFFHHGAIIRL